MIYNLIYNIIPSNASKKLVCYVRDKGRNHMIPCIPAIQQDLNNMLGIREQTYLGKEGTYLTLLHRIYLLTFMLRYQMPLQRKSSPGNRNLVSLIHCFKEKGWYCHLSRNEQKILNHSDVVITKESITDDLLHGISRSDMNNLSEFSYSDIQNTFMFRDGSMNSMEF